MARKQLEAYQLTKAERREQRRQKAPVTPVHDRRATDTPKGVIPAATDVPDPYDGSGGKITVIRNVRGDILAQLQARGQIDEHQYRAGRHWEELWERAEIGGVKAMDTTKEPVDGGGEVREPLTDRQRKAVRDLRLADNDLGVRGAVLVRLVLGRRMTIDQVASHAANGSHNDRVYFGRLFRDCLDELAVSFGYADRRLTYQANHL